MHILFQLYSKIYEPHTSGTIGFTVRTIALHEQYLYCDMLLFYYAENVTRQERWGFLFGLILFFLTAKAFDLIFLFLSK